MPVGKNLVKWALRRMGFQLTRLGSSAAAPSAVATVAAPRGSTSAALSQAARAGLAPRTVIDVGAALGEFSRQCFRVFPDAEYLLVEPLEEYRPNLDRLKADIPRASVVWAAAAGHEGMRDINVHRDLVGSSLYMAQEGSAVNGTLRRVRTVSLDDVVGTHRPEPPYLLKVDVQGAELEVLSGGEGVLRNVEWAMLGVSFFEFFKGAGQFEDVFEFMRSRGFVVYDLLEPLYRPLDGALSQVNAVFVRRESVLRKHHYYAARERRKEPVGASRVRAVRRRVASDLARLRGIAVLARRSPREAAQRVLIASARRIGLLPRLMAHPGIEKAVTVSGLYKPSRFLEAFVIARGLYPGLSELTLEAVYGLGASLESVLSLDQSRRGRQVALMLEAGGAKVQDVGGMGDKAGSALDRVNEFQGVIVGDLNLKDRAMERVSGRLASRHTVIVSSPTGSGAAGGPNGHEAADIRGEILVYRTPPAALLRRDG